MRFGRGAARYASIVCGRHRRRRRSPASRNRSANRGCARCFADRRVYRRPRASSHLRHRAIMPRLLRTAALLYVLSPLSLVAQHSATGGSRPALSPAREASQFDFLVGQWELVVTPKVNSLAAKIHGAPTFLGTWKAWRAVDGFGVEDEL